MAALTENSERYRRWYDNLMVKARGRIIPKCYTEVHHIEPRSFGGSDDECNLVRLTYHEHFIAHWLLTKFHTGGNLRKMQRALWAMTMKTSGGRVTTGWQFEAAKRAVRDLEPDPVAEAAWREKYLQAVSDKEEARKQRLLVIRDGAARELADLRSSLPEVVNSIPQPKLEETASRLLRLQKLSPPTISLKVKHKKPRARPRPGKRHREAVKQQMVVSN